MLVQITMRRGLKRKLQRLTWKYYRYGVLFMNLCNSHLEVTLVDQRLASAAAVWQVPSQSNKVVSTVAAIFLGFFLGAC